MPTTTTPTLTQVQAELNRHQDAMRGMLDTVVDAINRVQEQMTDADSKAHYLVMASERNDWIALRNRIQEGIG